ncbi:hypothetical protein [Mesorhizobium sp. B4-1-4]|uniref:hypothetical protein n=1 Tax=Mesorhizobium sp. B4-1-4 TaxID=2589888 RepID=UPI0011297C67|nr:hypothetical protein [Mesorhizobium sp. B4-1-4]UCI32146.1 hypothetical protein FJW03_01400 [Mesorhizobium sp. B4-1-4]
MTDKPEIPEALGQGINSIGLLERGDAIIRDNYLPSEFAEETMELLYVDSYSSLYSFLSVSAQASFSGFEGKVSGSMDFVRTITMRSQNIYFLLRKRFFSKRYRLVNASLTETALTLLKTSREDFLRTYGDEFVNSVEYGGILFVLIEIQIESRSETERLRAAVSGSSGPVSGSADVNSILAKASGENSINLQVSSVGLNESLPAHRPEKETVTKYIDGVFDFCNNFRAKLVNSGLGSELAYSTVSYDVVDNRAGILPLSFDLQKSILQDCVYIRDEINARIDVFRYAAINPDQFENGDRTLFNGSLQRLEMALRQVNDFAARLLERPAEVTETVALKEADLPSLPVPIPIVDIPVQVTLRSTIDPLLGGGTCEASGGAGQLVQLPFRSWRGVGFYPPVMVVDFGIARGARDVRIACSGRSLSCTSPYIGKCEPVYVEGLDGITCGDFGFFGLRFRLSGKDSSDYMLRYRAALDDRTGTPKYTAFGQGGDVIGSMDFPTPSGFSDFAKLPPPIIGLELQLLPKNISFAQRILVVGGASLIALRHPMDLPAPASLSS